MKQYKKSTILEFFKKSVKVLDFIHRICDNTNIMKKMKMKKLTTTITNLLGRGTAIASFDYNGTTRNVVIGANASSQGERVWGAMTNRAIIEHKGNAYLSARVNNDPAGYVKAFRLDKISNFKVDGSVV